MAEFQVRSDAVDVEQIMRQIRARIREKRGADYTEQEIRELASVKLEKFLDPRGVRSNLVEEFRRNRVPSPPPPKLDARIEPLTVSGTHRSALAAIRRILQPVLKLFINPVSMMHDINAAVQKLSATLTDTQEAINTDVHNRFRQREEMDSLYYEVIHNLVVELTRLSIENNNLKMRVESLASRVDFDERRARALESVVQYKPAPRQPERPQTDRPQGERGQQNRAPQTERPQGDRNATEKPAGDPATSDKPQDPQRAGLESRDQGERGERRRRRRRRRRPGQNLASGAPNGQGADANPQAMDAGGDDDGPDNDGPDDGGADEPQAQAPSSPAGELTPEGPKE